MPIPAIPPDRGRVKTPETEVQEGAQLESEYPIQPEGFHLVTSVRVPDSVGVNWVGVLLLLASDPASVAHCENDTFC